MKQELEGLHDLQAITKHIETNAQDCDPEVGIWEVDGWPNRTSRLVVISHQGFTSSDAKD